MLLFGFYNGEFFFSYFVIAAVFEHLIDGIGWDIHKGDFFLDADLADGVTGDVGVLERASMNVNEEKFIAHLKPIFQQGSTVIYEVPVQE